MSYGGFEQNVAVPTPSGLDGNINIDGSDTEIAFNLNALFEVSETTRFGLTYAYEVEPSFSSDVTITPSSIQAGIDATIIFPQLLRGSVYHQINKQWALVGTIGWENWSAFENITISTARGDKLIPRNWDDTWKFAAGVHYKLNERVLLQFGAAYDTSPIDDPKDRTPDMPIDEQIRLGAGVQYDWFEKINVGCAFTYAW